MREIEGIIVPILTPIHEDETPDCAQLKTLTDYVVSGGVNAIFANGTTGEFARFTPRERDRILRTVVDAAGGRVPVLAGISECGTRLALENAKRAEDLGADALVTTMPYYFPTTSPREQIDFMEALTSGTKLPVLLYNLPAVVGYSVREEVLDVLCGLDNLYGIKDTGGNTEYLDGLLRKYGGRTRVFVGDERLNYYGLSHGAAGLVPSLANPFPRVLSAAWRSARRGDWDECRRHCDLVDAMNELNRFSDSWMSPNIWRKEALAQMGVMNAAFTRPYTPVGPGEREKIREWIACYQARYPAD